MFRFVRWSVLLRPFRRPPKVDAAHPLLDDSARRLARAPEAPRRLDVHAPRFRNPHGRDPPVG